MKTYLKIIDNMDFSKLDEVDSRIEDVILNLKNGKFSNADKRKDFLKLLTILVLSNDPKARSLVKRMSKWLDDLGDEFLTVKDKEEFQTEIEDDNISYGVQDYERPKGIPAFGGVEESIEEIAERCKKEVYKFESDWDNYGVLDESEIKKDSEYGIGI